MSEYDINNVNESLDGMDEETQYKTIKKNQILRKKDLELIKRQ